MHQILTVFVLLLSFSLSYGQFYITLKNGKQIRSSNFKNQKDSLLLSFEGKNVKQKISIKEVTAYYSQLDYAIKYLKPSTLPKHLNSNSYQFLERLYSGRINLYYRKETRGTYGNYYPIEFYFLEKGDRFEELEFPGIFDQNRQKQIDFLKTFVNDHEPSLKKLDSNFRFTYNNILDFIRTYNLAMYEPPTVRDSSDVSEIIIYRRGKNKKNKPVKITLDQKEFFLSDNDFIMAKFNSKAVSKICVNTDENLTCELIDGHSYFQIYYEIRVNNKMELAVEKKDKKWAEFYLKHMKNWDGASNLKK